VSLPFSLSEEGQTVCRAEAFHFLVSPPITPAAQLQSVLRAFDAAWARNDLEGVVAIFAKDATLESPLVLRLLNRTDGALHGRDEIREMVRALMSSGTPWRGHDPPLIRGRTAAIEFKRSPSDGGQFYSVDIIEIREGAIQSLRAYSGWRALASQG
jgi:hypothetical protein